MKRLHEEAGSGVGGGGDHMRKNWLEMADWGREHAPFSPSFIFGIIFTTTTTEPVDRRRNKLLSLRKHLFSAEFKNKNGVL